MVRIDIQLPTDEEIDAGRRFHTYVNYVSHLGSYFRKHYSDPAVLVAEVASSRAFAKIQGGKAKDLEAVRRMLRNAWLTEIQMRIAARSEELVPYSNHWAPV